MAEYESHVAFFEANGDKYIKLASWGIERTVTLEEFYQHFKSRWLADLASECLDFDSGEANDG